MWLGRIWFEQIQRFECFSPPCSSSLFVIVSLIKVSMDEFLRLFWVFFFFSFLFFWLHLHLKWTRLSFPDQRLCFVSVWCEFYSETAEVIIVPEVLQPIELFFFFAPTCREGDIEQKTCFPPVPRWTDGSSDDNSAADFLPGVFFIHLSKWYLSDFRNHVLPALISKKNDHSRTSGACFCIKSEPGWVFFSLMTLPQEKNSGSMFPPLPVICFECAWWKYSI